VGRREKEGEGGRRRERREKEGKGGKRRKLSYAVGSLLMTNQMIVWEEGKGGK
jgi:hypothetical protein